MDGWAAGLLLGTHLAAVGFGLLLEALFGEAVRLLQALRQIALQLCHACAQLSAHRLQFRLGSGRVLLGFRSGLLGCAMVQHISTDGADFSTGSSLVLKYRTPLAGGKSITSSQGCMSTSEICRTCKKLMQHHVYSLLCSLQIQSSAYLEDAC